ncbi:LysM peptidoglycan-binding domain-containing protein [Streptococcus suis]|nr:LysM peptidoglycan-binding domain-containing protein [Streptococcus suis]
MKKFNFGYRKVGKVLVACAVAVATFGVANVASADTWVANSPESILIAPGQTTYELKLGDTLWAISQKINTSVEELSQMNGINLVAGEEKRLSVGRQIVLPGAVEKNQADEVTSEGVVNTNLSAANVNVVGASCVLSVEELMDRVESVEVTDGATHIKLKDGESMDDFVKDLEDATKETPKPVVPGAEEVPVKPFDPIVPETPIDATEEEPLITDKGEGVTHELPKGEIDFPVADKVHVLQNYAINGTFILIESNGRYGVVDTGNPTEFEVGTNKFYDYLDTLGVEVLDFVYITHFDPDHYYLMHNNKYEGLIYDKYEVQNVYFTPIEDTSIYAATEQQKLILKHYEDINRNLSERGIPVSDPNNISIGDFSISVIKNGNEGKNDIISNEVSNVLVVEKDGYTTTLLGDVEGDEDNAMIADKLVETGQQQDVAVLAHHGFSNSNTDYLLDSADFEVGIGTANTDKMGDKYPARYNEDWNNHLNEKIEGGVLWTGDGEVIVDFTDTSDGIEVTQPSSGAEVSLVHENGDTVVENENEENGDQE